MGSFPFENFSCAEMGLAQDHGAILAFTIHLQCEKMVHGAIACAPKVKFHHSHQWLSTHGSHNDGDHLIFSAATGKVGWMSFALPHASVFLKKCWNMAQQKRHWRRHIVIESVSWTHFNALFQCCLAFSWHTRSRLKHKKIFHSWGPFQCTMFVHFQFCCCKCFKLQCMRHCRFVSQDN